MESFRLNVFLIENSDMQWKLQGNEHQYQTKTGGGALPSNPRTNRSVIIENVGTPHRRLKYIISIVIP